MKVFTFFIFQTPVKPILPAWLRTLCQYDVCYRLLESQGYQVDSLRYVDDTGLQVAKLMSTADSLKIPTKNIGDYFGQCYVRANQDKDIDHKATQIKLELEQNPYAKKFLEPHLKEQDQFFKILGLPVANHFFESDLLVDAKGFIAELKKQNLILDYSPLGGEVFLDFTEHNMKLVTLRGRSGYTYLLKTLLFVNRLIKKQYDLIILQHIDEDAHPFLYIKKYLEHKNVSYIELNSARIKLGGNAESSRHGGWAVYTISELLKRFNKYNPADLRVGLRLYFLGVFDDAVRFNFSYDDLEREIRFAQTVREFIDLQRNNTDKQADISETDKSIIGLEKFTSSGRSLRVPGKLAKKYKYLYFKLKNEKANPPGRIELLNKIGVILGG